MNVKSQDLRGYVVWMPVTSYGGWETAAHQQAWRIPDRRITRYFDAKSHLGEAYAPILHLSGSTPAWDVYLVFGREAHWDSTPPAPSTWMHQLGQRAPLEQSLDPDKMTRAINELLEATGKKVAEADRLSWVLASVPASLQAPEPAALRK